MLRAPLCVLALLSLATSGCSRSQDDVASDDAVAPPARLEGQVRIADRWHKVAPLVLHDAKMDLATRCLIARDEAKAKGHEVPLCYDPNRRADRPVTRIAVERDVGLARAMRRLTAAHEGVHFLIEKNGAIYQVLDLAYPARHDGAYLEGAVRVIACDEGAERALIAALQEIFPAATVTTTDMSKAAEP
jgi:hypothetical protein